MVDDDDDARGGGRNGKKRESSWLANFQRDLMAGALMGGVVYTIIVPVERAKLILQSQESNLAIVGGGGHRRFKGMMDCIFRSVREEGFLSLWRGNGSSVLRYYPSVALNFSLKVVTMVVDGCAIPNVLNNGWSNLAAIYTRILENPIQQLDRYYNSFKELAKHRPLSEIQTAEEVAAMVASS